MITLRVSQRAHRDALRARRTGRPRHFAPTCDFLETRQLLSVAAFHAGPTVGALPVALVVHPVVSAPTSTIGGTPAGQITFDVPVAGNGAGQTTVNIEVSYEPSIVLNLESVGAPYGLGAVPSFSQPVGFGPQANDSAGALGASLDAGSAHGSASGSSIGVIVVNPGTTGLLNSSTGATPSPNSPITPITPTILATYSYNGRSVIVAIVVPQVPVANFGPSSVPVTTQAILATVALEEVPTPSTHFGQGSTDVSPALPHIRPIEAESPGPAGIDVIEPFQLDVPQDAPEAEAAAPPVIARAQQPRRVIPEPAFDLAMELAESDRLIGLPLMTSGDSEGRTEDSRATWTPSATMFGAAAVAIGGYQIALRQSDRSRSRGRAVPGRAPSRRRIER